MHALEIYKKKLGPTHTKVAKTLNNLAIIYKTQHKYAEAELLFTNSLGIFKNAYDYSHPNIITTLMNLTDLYRITAKNEKASKLDIMVKQLIAKTKHKLLLPLM